MTTLSAMSNPQSDSSLSNKNTPGATTTDGSGSLRGGTIVTLPPPTATTNSNNNDDFNSGGGSIRTGEQQTAGGAAEQLDEESSTSAAAGAAATGSSNTGPASPNQEEGLLRDVLDELDRERSKRAEIEAQTRSLGDELARLKRELDERQKIEDEKRKQEELDKQKQAGENSAEVSRREYLSMKAQVEGYQQLVNALTSSRPAISVRSSQIPIHVLRLLEVMPWDPAAQEYIHFQESLFEWQIYDARERKWQTNLRYFPILFKSLPVVKPKAQGDSAQEDAAAKHQSDGGSANRQQSAKDRSQLLLFLAGAATAGDGSKAPAPPSNQGTLTDERLSKLYNIECGFPLPENRGTWQWIGGWRVDKQHPLTASGAIAPICTTGESTDDDSSSCCDDSGWTYAREAQHFILGARSLLFNSPGTDGSSGNKNGDKSPPSRKIRRRKWVRRRMLVDYPYASERTTQYLKLLADNARLSVAVNKVSDQLVETKIALTETEEELFKARTGLAATDAIIGATPGKLDQQSLLKIVPNGDRLGGTEEAGSRIHGFLAKNEQVKELGSKLSQWVQSARKSSEDSTSLEGGAGSGSLSVTATEGSGSGELLLAQQQQDGQNKFDWKKIGVTFSKIPEEKRGDSSE